MKDMKEAICRPRHWNLGIETGIGTDTTNAIISTSTRPVGTKPNRVVIQHEGTIPTMSRDTSILWSRGK